MRNFIEFNKFFGQFKRNAIIGETESIGNTRVLRDDGVLIEKMYEVEQ